MAGKTHRVGPNIIETTAAFASEEACHAYLEKARWPNGVRCLDCGHDGISKFTLTGQTRTRKDGTTRKSPDRPMYQCLKCNYQFAATTGTIFGDTHLPLSKWMLATAIMCSAKKGVSAKQMERHLNVSYKTAWYLNHRLREAMGDSAPDIFTGIVEADATFIGGKYDKRRKRAKYDKQPVFGLIQRKTDDAHSKVHAQPVEIETRPIVRGIIDDRVSKDATIYTDESPAYKYLDTEAREHGVVIHGRKEYVRGNVHSNTIENFWSLFKRGLIGSFHQVSVKHLARYLAEFQFRFNNRQEQDIFAMVILGLLIKSELRYKDLTAKPSSSEQSPSDSDVPF